MANLWFIVRGEREMGPFDATQLRSLAAQGKLQPTHRLRRDDMIDPIPADRVKGLFTAVQEPPPIPARRAQVITEPPTTAEPTAVPFHKRTWFRIVWGAVALLILFSGAVNGLMQGGGGGFGKALKFNNGDLLYTSAVSEEDARRLGNFLVTEGYFDGLPKTVQLTRTNGTFEVRLVLKKGVELDPEYLVAAKAFCAEISQGVFGGAPVDIHMCDEKLNTLRVVVPL